MAVREPSLPAQLFAENDWRVLWWNLLLRMNGPDRFPTSEEDLEWLAFSAEMVTRHPNMPLMRRLRDIVAPVLDSPLQRAESEARPLLDAFAHECRNPALMADLEDGPWAPGPEQFAPRDEVALLADGPVSSLSEVVAAALNGAARRSWLGWQGSRHAESGFPAVFDTSPAWLQQCIGFANHDLAGLAAIVLTADGNLVLELDASIRDEGLARDRFTALRIAARFGFKSRSPDEGSHLERRMLR